MEANLANFCPTDVSGFIAKVVKPRPRAGIPTQVVHVDAICYSFVPDIRHNQLQILSWKPFADILWCPLQFVCTLHHHQ